MGTCENVKFLEFLELKNPWENFGHDYTIGSYGKPWGHQSDPSLLEETQDIYNNIKIHENRHAESSSVDPEVASGLLPYQAISWYHNQFDTCAKRERNGNPKRSKAPSKRSKRIACSVERDLVPLEVISETDSLSSLNEDGSKRVSSNVSEEESERLREPVLLKLAKSDGHSHRPDARKIVAPKIAESPQVPHTERSIWSVVYSKNQAIGELNKNLSISCSSTTHCHPSVVIPSGPELPRICPDDPRSVPQSSTTHRSSSYPPTPLLSPHLPSPTPSVVLDDIFATSSSNSSIDKVTRIPSNPSAHSSLSTTAIYSAEPSHYHPPILQRKGSCLPQGSGNLSQQVFARNNRILSRRSHKIRPTTSKQPVFSVPLVTHSFDEKDIEVDPYINEVDPNSNGRSQPDKFAFRESGLATGLNKLKDYRENRNGYHSLFKDDRASFASEKKCATPMTFFDTTRQRYLSHYMHNQIESPFDPVSSEHAFDPRGMVAASDWSNVSMPNTSYASSSKFARVSTMRFDESSMEFRTNASSWPKSPAMLPPPDIVHGETRFEEYTDDDTDDPFDSLTQCGCVEMDDLKCRNSLLCTVHTMDEKRRVPRQRDLRYLMREARQRQQLLRNRASGITDYQIPSASCSITGTSQPVIDLTVDCESPTSTRRAVDNATPPAAGTGFISNPQHTGSPISYRSSPQTVYGSAKTGRTSKILGSQSVAMSCLPSRFVRRLSSQTGSATSCPGIECSEDVNTAGDSSFSPMTLQASSDQMYDFSTDPVLSNSWMNESRTAVPEDQFSNRLGSVSAKETSITTSGKRQQRHYHHHHHHNQQQLQAQQERLRKTQVTPLHSSRPWSTHFHGACSDMLLPDSSSTFNETHVVSPLDVQESTSGHSVSQETGSSNLLSGCVPLSNTMFRSQAMSISSPVVIPTSLPQFTCDNRNVLERQSASSMSLVHQPVMVNRYTRSMYGPTQVLREPQGRVIVDDVREKSITGRSRKTARSTFRHAGPVLSNPAFTGLLHSRYQQQQQQQQQASQPQPNNPSFVSGPRKATTMNMFGTRSAIISRPIAGASADIFGGTSISSIPGFHLPESTSCSSVVSPNASLFSPTSSYTELTTGSPPAYPVNIGDNSMLQLDSVNRDYCVQVTRTSSPSFAPSTAQLPYIPMQLRNPNQHSNPPTFLSPESYLSSARVARAQTLQPGETGQVLCRNRYFVIRPGSVKRPPSLVVRTKRSGSCSTYPSGDSSSDRPATEPP